MKTSHKIAYNYVQALIKQRAYEAQLNSALQMINPDNQVFGLADPIEGPYTELVAELLGPELFDWLMWWMYETEHGIKDMEFRINGNNYSPTNMTLYSFLEVVDAND